MELRFTVVVNDEDQYALYPDDRELPPGWRPAGFGGTEDECVTWVDEHWTDMRPRTVRQAAGT
jgi:MbtH protein